MEASTIMALASAASAGTGIVNSLTNPGSAGLSNYQFHENLRLNWRDYHENLRRYNTSQQWAQNQWLRYTYENDRDYRTQTDQWQNAFAENQRQFEASQYANNWKYWDTATRSIQNRVNDARQAGVHPAIALGMGASMGGSAVGPGSAPGPMSTGGSGPPVIDGQSNVGGYNVDGSVIADRNRRGTLAALSEAAGATSAAMQDYMQLKKAEAEVEEINSRKTLNFTESQMLHSQMAQRSQRDMQGMRIEDRLYFDPRTPQGRPATATAGGSTYNLWGNEYKKNPRNSSAEDIEQHLGGGMGELQGLYNTLDEAIIPNYKKAWKKLVEHANVGVDHEERKFQWKKRKEILDRRAEEARRREFINNPAQGVSP